MAQSFVSTCTLCFNFLTPYRPEKTRKIKPLYSIFDFIEAEGNTDNLFPSGNDVQSTLGF
ncbi:MAG: hypothetical protein B2I17_03425 [Thermoplasmatales archaeon B_DKE]|nr:MAG: hypothetical protein B2I17_03425 [Thermoplasmatales archaeon B_DKE]